MQDAGRWKNLAKTPLRRPRVAIATTYDAHTLVAYFTNPHDKTVPPQSESQPLLAGNPVPQPTTEHDGYE
jgi:hypothetical protein